MPDDDDRRDEPRTYTQDEVNRMLRERLDRQAEQFARQYGDVDQLRTEHRELTERAGQLDAVMRERDELSKRVGELETAVGAVTLRAAVQAEAVRAGARHPDDVFALLPGDAVRIEDGKPVGVADAVKELAKSKPTYFGAGANPPDDGGARERSGPTRTPDMNSLIRAAAGQRG